MLEAIKSRFYDEKTGIKILPIALTAAGAFLLPMIPMIGGLGIAGNIIGAVAGMMLGGVVDGVASAAANQDGAGTGGTPSPKTAGGGDSPRVEVPKVPHGGVGAGGGVGKK